MGLKFRCKTCGEDVVVRFLKVGEAAECKNCGASNPVPESAQSADDETAAAYQSRASGAALLGPTPNVDAPQKPSVNHSVYANLNIDSLKRFALVVVKIACGISLAALIVGLGVWAVSTHNERSKAAENAQLATLKVWPDATGSKQFANATFHLRTVWRDGEIYYQFEVKGYPPILAQARRKSSAVFFIRFLDKDGFKLFEHTLPLSEMLGNIGLDDQPTGLSWEGDESITANLYRSAGTWNFAYAGFPETSEVKPEPSSARPSTARVPAPTIKPKWQDVSLWRGLSRGNSKGEVRRILGEPTKIEEFSSRTTWHYGGYPTRGELEFGQDGTLRSWQEP